MKKKLLAALMGAAFILGSGWLYKIHHKPKPVAAPPIIAGYSSVVGVLDYNKRGQGSGVILSNGRVLSAKHVLDVDGNGKLDDVERRCYIWYWTKDLNGESVRKESVAYVISSMNIDAVVIVAAHKLPASRVVLGEHCPEPGLQIVCIGRPAGTNPPHITHGVSSVREKDAKYSRASVSAFWGNSGGGIFTGYTLHGIVCRLRIMHNRVIPDWTEYLDGHIIRKELAKMEAEWMVDENLGPNRGSKTMSGSSSW